MPARIYHWKHGWIPLDHAAAMSKAKGSDVGARRYLQASHAAGHAHASVIAGSYGGGTHERGLQPVAAEHLPRDRSITAAFNPATRRFGLLHEHQGGFETASIPEHLGEHLHANGHRIVGIETHDGQKKLRVRTADGQTKLISADGADEHIVDAPAPTSDAPKDAREAFRMGGPELRAHAANGSTVAQQELDRRAAKRGGGKTETPKAEPAKPADAGQPKSLTPEERAAQNRGDLTVGVRVVLRVGGATRVGTVRGFHSDGRAQIEVPGHGVISRTAQDVSTTINPRTEAAEQRRRVGDFTKTPTETLKRTVNSPGMSEEVKAAMRAELARRGVQVPSAPPAPAPTPPRVETPPKPAAGTAAETAPTHVVKASSYGGGEKYAVLRPVAPGAKHGIIAKSLGDHITSNNFTVIGHNRKVVTTVDSAGTVRRFRDDGSNINAPTTGKLPSAKKFVRQDVGGWQHVPASEAVPAGGGSVGTSIVQSKIKRAYVKGNKRVVIETPLSHEQTTQFLGHVDTALAATGSHTDHPITFHVPSGNGHFRASRSGTTLAYVYRGDTSRVTVNPSVARGDRATPTDNGGHHMEAANHVHPTVYTLVHELGHVVDNKNQHTSQRTSFAALGREHTSFESKNAEYAFYREQASQGLSKYGRSSQPEGYAEAFAHYMLTHHGASSNNAAQRYAERYAWKWR